jgi:outer membrane lipase/esterase
VRATLLCLAGLLTATHASALPFTNVYVFGDSLMDVGNVYTATGGATPPSPPYFNGRWSNGPLAVDQFAADYGVTLKPSVLGGTGYAGAARALVPIRRTASRTSSTR